MKTYRLFNRSKGSQTEAETDLKNLYSVEFCVSGMRYPYQFKIRNNETNPMFVLVKEDSDILDRLTVGDVFKMKFYSSNSPYSAADLDTEIECITKNEQGRFKGHYLVYLAILQNQRAENDVESLPKKKQYA